MTDPQLRQNRRRGLLKGEQIRQLARDVAYGKRGKINVRDLQEQKNTCSCLTLILACIIYWQAKEINGQISLVPFYHSRSLINKRLYLQLQFLK